MGSIIDIVGDYISVCLSKLNHICKIGKLSIAQSPFLRKLTFLMQHETYNLRTIKIISLNFEYLKRIHSIFI